MSSAGAPSTSPTPIRLRGGRSGSLRSALILLSACVLFLGGLQMSLTLARPDLLWSIVLFTAAFWIWAFAGIVAWWRRPSNATGPLIVVGGLALFLGGLGNVGIGVLDVLGALLATTTLGVTVHLLHAFPSGRLRGRLSIATVAVGYVITTVFQGTLVVFAMGGRQDLFTAFRSVQGLLGLLVMAVTGYILLMRLRAADRAHRRVLLPLFAYSILAVLGIALAPLIGRSVGMDPVVIGITQLTLSVGIPVAFLIGVLVGGFTRTGDLEALSAWLGIGGVTRPAVGRALAATMGDESLRIVYWSPEKTGYVDEFGRDVDSSVNEAHRGWVQVRVGERLVGAIVYDTRMIGDPYPVSRAADVLAIAIDRERLTAELIASNAELLQSRVRIVETADRERSRIAQDLHDGIQVQLVLLALDAQNIATAAGGNAETAARAAELRRRIDAAAADLRRLVHNVLPAALVEKGLTVATEDLVDRLSIPATLEAHLEDQALSGPTTHTAYFIIAEVLTNAVKHSRAKSVRVRLQQSDGDLHLEVFDDGVGGASAGHGSGLVGVIDRVDVLGGRFQIDSPKGAGTRVKVVLPCA